MWGELDTVDVMLVNVDAKLSDLHNGEVGGTPKSPEGGISWRTCSVNKPILVSYIKKECSCDKCKD